MILEDLRSKIVKTARQMARDGLVQGTWGNVSARSNTGLWAITPSGMAYDSLEPGDIVVMAPDGRLVDGIRRASTESPLHRVVYKSRPDVKAIVHTHSTYATAFACCHKRLPVYSTELASLVGDVVTVARFAPGGTKELGEAAVCALGSEAAVLLANHGTLCVGSTLEEAYNVALGVEEGARLFLIANAIGDPVPLPPQYGKMMFEFYRQQYGQRL